MTTHRARAREPRPPVSAPPAVSDAHDVATYLVDAARYPGGHTPRVHFPRTEGEVAWVVRNEPRLIAVGARSSLTGGATPRGEAVLATERMDRILGLEGDRVRVEPGVALSTLRVWLEERNAFYPPAPTFDGALVGGTVSTNAAGAATWKYGTTRAWVEALTVVLASGHVLELRRGEVMASRAGTFELELPDGRGVRIPVPGYTMPDVPKRSAGYHAAPGMDLVDLFIGAEGTLGVVVEVELRVLRDPPPLLVALVPLRSEALAIELTRLLRDGSRATWRGDDPGGLDLRAIESLDRRSVELVREDGEDKKQGVALPDWTEAALLVQLELPRGFDAEQALSAYAAGEPARDPLSRLLALLAEHEAADEAELALPGDAARAAQLYAVREAVPSCVAHRIRDAQRDLDPAIHKVGGDMIVPFERFAEAMAAYRRELSGRGLDHAIWGHISDGNVHPNVLPRSVEQVRLGEEALLACGRAIAALGGCPLSEHGTGRSPIKQSLLRGLYGSEGVAAMRAVKQALDPEGRLARDVIFPWRE